MAAELITLPFRPVINTRGVLEPGALLDVFQSGTTTRVSVFSDAALTAPLSNPVVANASGVFPTVYFDNATAVRVRVRQANGSVLGDADPYYSDGLSSTDLSFLQSGSGAVTRTVQAKLRETVSVKDFGAVGDGVANDTAAIQAAVNAASTVIFPSVAAGNFYRVTGPITIPANRTIRGDNGWLAIVESTALDAPIFQATDVANVDIIGIHLRYSGTPTSGADAIRLTTCQTCRLHNIWVSKSWNGIRLITCGNIDVSGYWSFQYRNSAIVSSATINVALSNFLFEAGDSVNGAAGGIRLEGGCEQFLASNGGIQRGVYGMTTDRFTTFARGNAPFYNRFVNVYFDSNKEAAVRLRFCAYMDFTACWFSSAGYDEAGGRYTAMLDRSGIDISDCTDVSFNGGEALANGGRGALVFPSCERIRFGGGMRFAQNQKTRASNGAAIQFLNESSDFAVQGCVFFRDPDTAQFRQTEAVNVQAGTADRYIIADNLLGGCTVFDGGSGTNKRVAANF